MKTNSVPLDYANTLMFELEKAFFDERGKGARFRMTTVGREFFQEKCLPRLKSGEVDHIIATVRDLLKEEGIAADVTCTGEDRLLRVRVEGCIHRPVEDRMVARGVEPFTCVPANLIVLAIEEKLDRPVELAEIKLVEGACQLLLVIFDNASLPGLGAGHVQTRLTFRSSILHPFRFPCFPFRFRHHPLRHGLRS